MKIAVCCKFTPDTEDIAPAADGTVDLSRASWGVSEYDRQAIQAASDLAGDGDEVVALSVGPALIAQSKLVKELLSRGKLSALYRVADDAVDAADGAAVARMLANLVREVQPELVLFGEGSSDRYARTTGSLVAAELGWPSATAVDALSLEGAAVVAERDLEDGVEVVEMALPCAVSVTSTINVPETPGMKAVLAAGKKQVEDRSADACGFDGVARVEVVASEVPPMPGRLLEMIEGTPEEIARQLVGKLSADGVL